MPSFASSAKFRFSTLSMRYLAKNILYITLIVCGCRFLPIGERSTLRCLLAGDQPPTPVWEGNACEPGIAEIALTIAKESYPETDAEFYLKKLNEIIANVRTSLHGETEPEQIIKTVNGVLFNELQFTYIQTGDLEYMSLNRVLDTGIGNCVVSPSSTSALRKGCNCPSTGLASRNIYSSGTTTVIFAET